MPLRAQLVVLAAIAVTLAHLSSAAMGPRENKSGRAPANQPQMLALPVVAKLNEVQKAYVDAYSILSQDNSCSEFFGGRAAITVLNQLIQQLQTASLDKEIGMRMRGRARMFVDADTGLSYRLFKAAEVNLNGAFYQGNGLPNRPRIPRVGNFEPNTREARATVLLHELGHLIEKPERGWLLPDDGDDPSLSSDNTGRILQVCRQQIRELHNHTFRDELLSMQAEQIAANATPGKSNAGLISPLGHRLKPDRPKNLDSGARLF